MQKVLIEIKNNSLEFCCISRTPFNKTNLLNTNVINNNELLFSIEYILNNLKIVSIFIKELCEENFIETISINNMDYVDLIMQVLTRCNIKTIVIKDEVNFTYKAYESIIKNSSIKKVNCFSISYYMIELFDKHDITVESRQEVLFTSSFMSENNLNQYSKIYYKTSIRIPDKITEEDLMDLEAFLKINRYLKLIHFNTGNVNNITAVINILKKLKIKNKKINIHDNVTDAKVIEELKLLNKNSKKNNIELKLTYSKEYIKNNYIKQIILTTISYCLIIIIGIATMCLSYIVYNNYKSEKKIEQINEMIGNKLNNDLDISISEQIKNIEKDMHTEDPDYVAPEEEIIENKKINALKELNPDTVAWLQVPMTNIDYPVVQGRDNEYYLDHNFNKEHDYSGWVFMNFQNNSVNLDRNTIIFAHNRYYSGVMFGTLSKINKPAFYKNTSNNLISLYLLQEDTKWEVFSIYSIDVTNDYLKTSFKDDAEFLEFASALKERSEFESDIKIKAEDKILTLSTCLDNNKRLVVHAVLKEK